MFPVQTNSTCSAHSSSDELGPQGQHALSAFQGLDLEPFNVDLHIGRLLIQMMVDMSRFDALAEALASSHTRVGFFRCAHDVRLCGDASNALTLPVLPTQLANVFIAAVLPPGPLAFSPVATRFSLWPRPRKPTPTPPAVLTGHPQPSTWQRREANQPSSPIQPGWSACSRLAPSSTRPQGRECPI
jgi:hypothetical protein